VPSFFIKAEHLNQVKELEEKLNTAKAAAEAASKIAEQAKAEISAIQGEKTKESRCTIS
jgi:outer membrane murein-binding lipoprotein Lpp